MIEPLDRMHKSSYLLPDPAGPLVRCLIDRLDEAAEIYQRLLEDDAAQPRMRHEIRNNLFKIQNVHRLTRAFYPSLNKDHERNPQ